LAICIFPTFSNKCLDQPGVRRSESVCVVELPPRIAVRSVGSQATFCSAAVHSGADSLFGEPLSIWPVWPGVALKLTEEMGDLIWLRCLSHKPTLSRGLGCTDLALGVTAPTDFH
jgi:hypothetical protein